MATIRIHEDQENRIVDLRRGKENSANQANPLQLQNKRPVLAVLHNNCHRNAKIVSTQIHSIFSRHRALPVFFSKFVPFFPNLFHFSPERIFFPMRKNLEIVLHFSSIINFPKNRRRSKNSKFDQKSIVFHRFFLQSRIVRRLRIGNLRQR